MFFEYLTKVDDARVGATLTHVDQLALDAVSAHSNYRSALNLPESLQRPGRMNGVARELTRCPACRHRR